jgi:hypothetical protein
MIPASRSPLANHVWQSTLFAAVAALLTLALRKNRAQVRYWLWLAASLKFLVPFSLIVGLGSRFGSWIVPATPAQLPLVVAKIGQPFVPGRCRRSFGLRRRVAAGPPLRGVVLRLRGRPDQLVAPLAAR